MKPCEINWFARLVSCVTHFADRQLSADEIDHFSFMIEQRPEPEQMPAPKCDVNLLHNFIAIMNEGKMKIEAIKMHRLLTGYGLKESKDFVEKYWPVNQRLSQTSQGATLSDILNKAQSE